MGDWQARAEAAEAEVARLQELFSDADGRFRESGHLIPKWAKDLRTAERQVQQLRGDITSWQGMCRAASARADRAEHDLRALRASLEASA